VDQSLTIGSQPLAVCPVSVHDVCEQLLQEVSFSGDPSGTTPNACQGQWECSPCCTMLPGPPTESTIVVTVENSVCPKHPVYWQDAHPWNVTALTRCGNWSCASLGAHQGKSGGCSLCSGIKGCVSQPLATDWVHALPCLWFQPSFRHDGTAQGQRYCSARGEILRPLQDQQQRRRLASACSSIKNESVGSKDDQTPS